MLGRLATLVTTPLNCKGDTTGPVAPVKPVNPVKPVGPVKPVKPVAPTTDPPLTKFPDESNTYNNESLVTIYESPALLPVTGRLGTFATTPLNCKGDTIGPVAPVTPVKPVNPVGPTSS